MEAHSVVQYNFYKADLSALDRETQENAIIRKMVIKHETNFSQLKQAFLNRMESEGKLFCIYCQLPLKIYTGTEGTGISGKPPSDLATIEHLIPTSQGGLKYHESNWACACWGCNNRRGVQPIFKITETEYIW